LEVLPGVRFEQSQIGNRFWTIPQTASGVDLPGHFASNHTVYNEPLPSLQINYRPAGLSVYRVGVWTSYVSPSLFQLGGSAQTVNSGGGAAAAGGTTTITEGNPDLKPVQSVNLDVSGDWASLRGGQASAALFYKALNHFIYDNTGAGFTNLTVVQTGGTFIDQPRNGGSGRVYGLELAGRQPLFGPMDPLRGLGVGGDLTWSQSSVNTLAPGLSPHERLLNQPDLEANLQLYYERSGVTARLFYRYVGDYVAQYKTLGDTSALDTWVRPAQRMDLSLAYATPFGAKVSFSVANLLDDMSYVATVGRKSWAIPSLVYSGRTYGLNVKYRY
jgi:TonB-dependent receptor